MLVITIYVHGRREESHEYQFPQDAVITIHSNRIDAYYHNRGSNLLNTISISKNGNDVIDIRSEK